MPFTTTIELSDTLRDFYHFQTFEDTADIESIISKYGIPTEYQHSTVKCRLLYGVKQGEFVTTVEYSQYKKRSILSLKLVEGSLDYSFKIC